MAAKPNPTQSSMAWSYYCPECDEALDARENGGGEVILSCMDHGDRMVACLEMQTDPVTPDPLERRQW